MVGVDLSSPNKGCEALAYASLELINQIANRNKDAYEVYVIRKLPLKDYVKAGFSKAAIQSLYAPKHVYSNLKIYILFIQHIKDVMLYNHKISEMDYVIDFTGGDSFTDIYGKKRFYSRTKFKENIMNHNIPLILGSQTIGPFSNDKVSAYAGRVIEKSLEVFVRDQLSYDCVKDITGREAILTTDVAFALPYKREEILSPGKIKVGLNISGLLWNGGYSKDNQFGLKVDYQKYCRDLIRQLLVDGYAVYLVPHAFKHDLTDVDNDLVPVLKLNREFSDTVVSPYFDSCIEAKSYIAGLDIFVGARMHSTIAAFSAGVPVIPFSYSRKFEGLFQSLNYPFVLNARELETEECTQQTLKWIKEYKKLKDNLKEGHLLIQSKLDIFLNRIEDILYSNNNMMED